MPPPPPSPRGPRRVARAPAAALCLLVSLGTADCGGEPSPPDAGTPDAGETLDDPTLEFGTGQLEWEPVAPRGTPLELIHGPQGGYHLFGRVRSARLPPAVELRFRVTLASGGPALNNPEERITLRLGRGLRPSPDGGWETSTALLLVLENIRGPEAVVGRTLRIETRARPLDDPRAAVLVREVRVVDET